MGEILSSLDNRETKHCSIIIPTRDQIGFLRTCIEGILASHIDFNYEIVVVDNDSEEAISKEYLREIAEHDRIRVLLWHKPFNYSAINNFAAAQCNSELLCFLNNDIEIIDKYWLTKLAVIANAEDIGAVGCRLLYPDDTIQHAGVALDQTSVAKHIGLSEPSSFLSDLGISGVVEVPAVTAACLVMRKDLFSELGGFDEENLAVSYNDVDLCLRIAERRLPILLESDVAHIHHESISRQSDELDINRPRALQEFEYMKTRWASRLQGESYDSGLPAFLTDQTKTPRLKDMAAGQNYPVSKRSSAGGPHQQLEQRYRELQAHVQRVEEAHRLIENSIFWRITAPLRALRNFIFGGGGTSEPSESNPITNEDTVVASAALSNHGNSTTKPPDSKEAHKAEAKSQLELFLSSEKTLVFPSHEQPAISILLVFYNNAPLSFLCLQSILQYADVSYEVIIVDNDSSDDTDQLLSNLENATIIRNSDNLGFVKAVNQGAEQARGENLLLLNNDAALEENCLSAALNTLNSSDDIGAVGGKIVLLDGNLQEAGSIIWSDGACLGYGRNANIEDGEYMFRRDVDYCSGAFLLFNASLFSEMDGFDEDYAPAYYEESDFCIRLQERGLRIVYEPQAVITHYEFASTGGISGASQLQQEHREILCRKHGNYLSQQKRNASDKALFARTANRHPNILIIDDRVPYPSLGAGYPRCCHILNSLSKMPANLTFYPLLFPDDDWEKTYEVLPREIEVMLNKGRTELANFLRERRGFFDTIMVSRVHNMEIFNEIVKSEPALVEGCRIVYDAEAISAPREVLRRRFWGENVSAEEEQEEIKAELRQAMDSDCVLAVSAQEAAIYQQRGISNTVVLGHTVDLKPDPAPFAGRHGLLFVGALRDEGSPNVDSLLWFLVNCLPLIEKKLPDVRLYVVGDSTAPSLSTVTKDNVIFTGRLDSIEDIYDQCRVFVAPTRFAAGIPHKIHEAAGNGIPSVATALLARQLGWEDGQELLVADTPELFAEQCVRLHTDENLWQSVQAKGMRAVDRDCSDENFRRSLTDALLLEPSQATQGGN